MCLGGLRDGHAMFTLLKAMGRDISAFFYAVKNGR